MESWIDISRPVQSGAAVYPGDPPVRLERVAAIGPGSPFQLSEISASVHLLTHLDAPAHFVPGGQTIDLIPLERFCGPALVVAIDGDAISAEAITAALDEQIAAAGKNIDMAGLNLLFKTRHSSAPLPAAFDERHAHLTLPAARMLAEAGVNLVGIDYLDIEAPGDSNFLVHRTLLESGVLILEGLDLAAARPGRWTLSAFPLRLAGAEAAPCRAVLGC